MISIQIIISPLFGLKNKENIYINGVLIPRGGNDLTYSHFNIIITISGVNDPSTHFVISGSG